MPYSPPRMEPQTAIKGSQQFLPTYSSLCTTKNATSPGPIGMPTVMTHADPSRSVMQSWCDVLASIFYQGSYQTSSAFQSMELHSQRLSTQSGISLHQSRCSKADIDECLLLALSCCRLKAGFLQNGFTAS